MEIQPNGPRFPTDWSIRFLCDCKKENKEIRIHQGIAHRISAHGVQILSDHNICQQKKVAMQLMIPPMQAGAPQQIVKIIGHSIETIKKEIGFLTEIKFRHFEENGQQVLEDHLNQRFDPHFHTETVQRA